MNGSLQGVTSGKDLAGVVAIGRQDHLLDVLGQHDVLEALGPEHGPGGLAHHLDQRQPVLDALGEPHPVGRGRQATVPAWRASAERPDFPAGAEGRNLLHCSPTWRAPGRPGARQARHPLL